MQNKFISAILLAGGLGTRMQASTPKQFLTLKGKPVARHSFDLFLAMPEIHEIIVVCEPEYRHLFQEENPSKKIAFASPGSRRQDSVYNGLNAISKSDFVCIHDSARPFIDRELVVRALNGAVDHGAATVGMPVKFTVKQSDGKDLVHNTPDRSLLWEIQTPQVVDFQLLHKGFQFAIENNLTVTDDVSLVELLKKTVKLVEGCARNIKITVPADLKFATYLLDG